MNEWMNVWMNVLPHKWIYFCTWMACRQLSFTVFNLFRNKYLKINQFFIYFFTWMRHNISPACATTTKICTRTDPIEMATKKMYRQVFRQPYKAGLCYISCSERQTFKHQLETVSLQIGLNCRFSSVQLPWKHRPNIRYKLLICKVANCCFPPITPARRASACPHAAALWEPHERNGRGYT